MVRKALLLILLFSSSLFAEIIHRKAYQTVCDFEIISLPSDFDPAKLEYGSCLYVQQTCLNEFFQQVFPYIKKPFVLVTSVGSGTIDGTYLAYLESDKILHWFAASAAIVHPKLTGIPLGVPMTRADEQAFVIPSSTDTFFAEKKYSVFVNWRKTHPFRGELIEYFKHLPGAFVCPIVPFHVYVKLLSESRFVISPRGLDFDCYRTWEALYRGSIPVVQAERIDPVYENLPVICVPDLNQVTEETLEEAFADLKGREFAWEKLNLSYWAEQFHSFKTKK